MFHPSAYIKQIMEHSTDVENATTCDVQWIEEITADYYEKLKECDGDIEAVDIDRSNPQGYVFNYKGATGVFQYTTRYLRRKDALHFILKGTKVPWLTNRLPPGFPENKIGSYIFLVQLPASDSSKDITADWLRPWNAFSKDGRRVTPKWEKAFLSECNAYLRMSKSRHPQYSWIKRQIIFLSDSDGIPTSSAFYQYVVESEGEIPLSEVSSTSVRDNTPDASKALDTVLAALASSSSGNAEPLNAFLKSDATSQKNDFSAQIANLLKVGSSDEKSDLASELGSISAGECGDGVEQVVEHILDNVVSCRQALRSAKQQYCDANSVSEMKKLSTKCEGLATWLEDVQKQLRDLATSAGDNLQGILGKTSVDGSRKRPAEERNNEAASKRYCCS